MSPWMNAKLGGKGVGCCGVKRVILYKGLQSEVFNQCNFNKPFKFFL